MLSQKRLVTSTLTLAVMLSLAGVYALPWNGLTLWERWTELRSGSIFRRADTRARVIALTFDDGPDPRYTGRVLDVLRANHVRATFFVVGERVERYPDLARRVVREGHVLGNHTETHPHLESEANPAIRLELEQCEDHIEQITGERTYLFRPPRGVWNPTVFRDARRDGYRIILWSLAFDRHAIPNPDALRRRVVRLARPGDIVLMHDGSSSKSDERRPTVVELSSLIAGLRARGFRFVTVPELLHIAGNAPVRVSAHAVRQ